MIQTGNASHGAILLAAYCAGLAVPFLLTGLAFGTATTAFAVIKRHYPVVIGTGGAVLIAMGILMWTGEFTTLNITDMRIVTTEAEMAADNTAQYRNWATPRAAISLLQAIHESSPMGETSVTSICRGCGER